MQIPHHAEREYASSSITTGGGGSEPESRRYRFLSRCIDKALTESRSKLDARSAVKECYGDDCAIFADEDSTTTSSSGTARSGEEVLAELVDNVIENANDRLRSELEAVLGEGDVQVRLRLLDSIIDRYSKRDRDAKLVEETDRNSARAAADMATLPPGVTPQDVLTYHAHHIKVQERDALLDELAMVEADNDSLRKQIDRGTELIRQTVKDVEDKGKIMERTADVGTFSGVC
mmetsp:Transcript_7103/g.13956  ORF Transcript_7103/g.13956 Transcript_7103/m.13956 type:complete len:233 (-) Transcript_7103:413-1111(-)